MKFIFWINLSWSLLIVNSIMIPMFIHYGLTFHQIALVTTTLHLTIMLVDLPFGFLADKIGTKKSLLLASIMKGIGGTIPIFFPTFYGFLFTFFTIGLANGMYSGSDLKQLSQMKATDGSCNFAKRAFYVQVGLALGGIIGSLFVDTNNGFTIPLLINFVTSWIPFLLSLVLTLSRSEVLQKDSSMPRSLLATAVQAKSDFHFYWKNSIEFKLNLQRRIGIAVVVGIVSAFAQALWHKLQLPIQQFGWVWFLQALMAILLLGNIRYLKKMIPYYFELSLFVAPLVALLGFTFYPLLGFLSIPLVFAMELTKTSANSLLIRNFNEGLPKESIVSLNSVATTTSSILLCLCLPIVGKAIDVIGFQTTFSLFLVFACGLLSYLYFMGRANNGEAKCVKI